MEMRVGTDETPRSCTYVGRRSVHIEPSTCKRPPPPHNTLQSLSAPQQEECQPRAGRRWEDLGESCLKTSRSILQSVVLVAELPGFENSSYCDTLSDLARRVMQIYVRQYGKNRYCCSRSPFFFSSADHLTRTAGRLDNQTTSQRPAHIFGASAYVHESTWQHKVMVIHGSSSSLSLSLSSLSLSLHKTRRTKKHDRGR